MLPHLELDGLSWGPDGAPKQGIRYTAVFASLPGMLRPRHQDNGLPGGHEGGQSLTSHEKDKGLRP